MTPDEIRSRFPDATPHMRAQLRAERLPPAPGEWLVEWPEDDRRDSFGRLMISCWWLARNDSDHPERMRGQVFLTNPEQMIDELEHGGRRIEQGRGGWSVRLIDPPTDDEIRKAAKR